MDGDWVLQRLAQLQKTNDILKNAERLNAASTSALDVSPPGHNSSGFDASLPGRRPQLEVPVEIVPNSRNASALDVLAPTPSWTALSPRQRSMPLSDALTPTPSRWPLQRSQPSSPIPSWRALSPREQSVPSWQDTSHRRQSLKPRRESSNIADLIAKRKDLEQDLGREVRRKDLEQDFGREVARAMRSEVKEMRSEVKEGMAQLRSDIMRVQVQGADLSNIEDDLRALKMAVASLTKSMQANSDDPDIRLDIQEQLTKVGTNLEWQFVKCTQDVLTAIGKDNKDNGIAQPLENLLQQHLRTVHDKFDQQGLKLDSEIDRMRDQLLNRESVELDFLDRQSVELERQFDKNKSHLESTLKKVFDALEDSTLQVRREVEALRKARGADIGEMLPAMEGAFQAQRVDLSADLSALQKSHKDIADHISKHSGNLHEQVHKIHTFVEPLENLMQQHLRVMRGHFEETLNRQAVAFEQQLERNRVDFESILKTSLGDSALQILGDVEALRNALRADTSEIMRAMEGALHGFQNSISEHVSKHSGNLHEQVSKINHHAGHLDNVMQQHLRALHDKVDHKFDQHGHTQRLDLNGLQKDIAEHISRHSGDLREQVSKIHSGMQGPFDELLQRQSVELERQLETNRISFGSMLKEGLGESTLQVRGAVEALKKTYSQEMDADIGVMLRAMEGALQGQQSKLQKEIAEYISKHSGKLHEQLQTFDAKFGKGFNTLHDRIAELNNTTSLFQGLAQAQLELDQAALGNAKAQEQRMREEDFSVGLREILRRLDMLDANTKKDLQARDETMRGISDLKDCLMRFFHSETT